MVPRVKDNNPLAREGRQGNFKIFKTDHITNSRRRYMAEFIVNAA